MIIIIDNYDSFTYNLAQYISELGILTKVYRNDSITLEQIEKLSPSAIIISPGPGSPLSSGISLDIIRNLYTKIPILGVCLGHQAIAMIFGGYIIHAPQPIHGKTSSVYHDSKGVFQGLPNPLNVTRYHSLVMSPEDISKQLEITAWTDEGIVMACKHKIYSNVQGIQFHPESLWTDHGRQLLNNFISNLD
uniref:Anthranilate synthase component 2 n=1 Tax=Helminthora furcellata TaxID=1884666 RepID=A0A1G4NR50_9FLOR|nr:Anthranilate synthase component II [Helminthora furcellata]SCW21046.1 Anthranilate synthase component II [Helminthora furcellata]SCW23906.1 Anthranilate synthase component II [Helminthora furcellata]